LTKILPSAKQGAIYVSFMANALIRFGLFILNRLKASVDIFEPYLKKTKIYILLVTSQCSR